MTSDRRTAHDVFLSYAHADDRDGFVSALRDAIEVEMAAFVEGGVDVCFFDKSHIETMADWEATILAGLRSSRMLLAVRPVAPRKARVRMSIVHATGRCRRLEDGVNLNTPSRPFATKGGGA